MYLYIPSNSAPGSACLAKASELHSDFLASTTEPFFTWNGKLQQPPSLSRLWKREPSIRRLSGLTYSPSTAEHGVAQWISSLLASRAKTSASPVGAQVLTARGLGSSSTSSTLPTIAVRGDSFWRTSQASLLPPPPLWTKPKANSKSAQPPASWENWPTVGGMRNGSLFPHPTWVPAMAVPGGSVSPGAWPTPQVGNGENSHGQLSGDFRNRMEEILAGPMWMTPSVSNSQGNEYTRDRGQQGQERLTLTGQAQQWPIPRGTDGTKGGPNQAGSKGDLMLPSAAAQWPTPSASLANDGESPETWHARAAKLKVKHGNGNGVGLPLTVAAVQWPTPASRDYRTPNSQESRKHTGGEQLPNFVEHHFYSPQALPILDGQTSSPATRTSPLRLNPAFGCWLMGMPWWWTNPGLTNSVRSEMVSWRHKLDVLLSSFFDERAFDEKEAA